MRKGSGCGSASHRRMKDRARARVDDLQGMISGIQSARKDGLAGDAAVLEDQVHRMLGEWKAELAEASPASSLLGSTHASADPSLDIGRLLKLCEEEDGTASGLAELLVADPKPEPLEVLGPVFRSLEGGGTAAFQEDYYLSQELQESGFLGADQYESSFSIGLQHALLNCLESNAQLNYQQFNRHQELPQSLLVGFNTSGQHGGNAVTHISDFIPVLRPPPSAFRRLKCALWDCPRPAQGSEWWQDYCSSFHATLALNEGPPGMGPVLRPGGIDLKDGPLFAALSAKTQGKNVGIPECEGAATTKSPWNAPELFDLSVLKGESLREWLFFDKPRRAFESGNRKQRSLPDYGGRGWHESRKQVMKEFGGLKRSYYMDPQPLRHYEWHLYEYEINGCDACALYRLELKLVDPNKSIRGRITSDSLSDLQQQMRRLNAEINPVDNKRYLKARARVNQKDVAENVYSTPSDKMIPAIESLVYGPSFPYNYSVDSFSDYYGT